MVKKVFFLGFSKKNPDTGSMSPLIKKHYCSSQFEEALSLTEAKPSWDALQKKVPNFPRGFFELCNLELSDRIEFFKEYWLKTLPYAPKASPRIETFFQKIEDIGVYVVKTKEREGYNIEFVYSISQQNCFFRGGPPLTEEEINSKNHQFNYVLPKDYLSFFQIHNGFARHNDIGIICLEQVKACQEKLFQRLEGKGPQFSSSFFYERDSLIPFYECFGLHSYQCFFKEWRPTPEMGNVYFSGVDYTISDTSKKEEDLAFETFLDWLVFYLEGRET